MLLLTIVVSISACSISNKEGVRMSRSASVVQLEMLLDHAGHGLPVVVTLCRGVAG